jgi:dihydrodipicolinate reductase
LLNADNVEFYVHNRIPFVVGTTGGDREKLMQDARTGNAYAVIAPQMGKQACPTSQISSHHILIRQRTESAE